MSDLYQSTETANDEMLLRHNCSMCFLLSFFPLSLLPLYSSRSATLVLAFLIERRGMTLKQAVDTVR